MEKWQCQLIKSKIADLVTLTDCNTSLIAKLLENELLSSNDVDCLKRVRYTDGHMGEVFELYRILQTRKNAYENLISALEFTKQTGAVKILQEGCPKHHTLPTTVKSANLLNEISNQDGEPPPSAINIHELNSKEQTNQLQLLSSKKNMDFNTIVRLRNGEILGKLQMDELNDIPFDWRIAYMNKSFFSGIDLNTMLCNEKFPISVYIKLDIPGCISYDCHPTVMNTNPMKVYVEILTVGTKTFNIQANSYVVDLKRAISETIHKPTLDIRLIFNGRQLNDHLKLSYYNVVAESTLHAVLKLRGGGLPGAEVKFELVNLNERPVLQSGIRGKHKWRTYGAGLNPHGICPNKLCKSNLSSNPVTFCQVGYGDIRLEKQRNKFECSACESYFTPTNFLVSSAQALFRFRKEGCREHQWILLKSSGGLKKYTELYPNGKKDNYDLIEIRTVRETESVYSCVSCNEMIGNEIDVVMLDCSHTIHRKCKDIKGCCVCKAPFITEQDFHTFVSNYIEYSEQKCSLVKLERSLSDSDCATETTGFEIRPYLSENVSVESSSWSCWKFFLQCCFKCK